MPENASSSPSDFPPCLDRDTIASLIQLGEDDPSLFSDLVDTFLADSPERLGAMDAAARSADATLLARSAHGLKSSAGNMGARMLAELCAELERRGRSGDLSGVDQLVARAQHEFESAGSALRSLVK